jgi:hypothetical protein
MIVNQKNLNAVKERTIVLTILSILFLTLPGIAILFFFRTPLFLHLDWMKLVLIGATLMAPLVLINTVLIGSLDHFSTKDEKEKLFISFCTSAFISGVIAYVVIILNFFRDFSVEGNIFLLLAAELALIVSMILNPHNTKPEVKRSSRKVSAVAEKTS